MAETIQIYNKNGGLVYELEPNERCRRYYQLMGEDYITLEFADAYRPAYTNANGERVAAVPPPTFHIGDYCEVDGEKYVVNDHTKPTYNAANGGYNYSLRMVAEYRTWNNIVVKEVKREVTGTYKGGSVIFKYTASLREHARLLLSVLALYGFYSADEIRTGRMDAYIDVQREYFATTKRDAEKKLMTYEGTDVLEAITQLCSAEMYDCEWWVTRNGARYTLHFGRRETDADEIVKIETGVNAASISEESSQTEYANRIYILGGTQNVPYSYRKKLLFTNAGTETALTDTSRKLEYDQFKNGHRETKYDRDMIDKSKMYISFSENVNKFTLKIAHANEIPVGKYKLGSIGIEHVMTMDAQTYKGFVVWLQYTLKGEAVIGGSKKSIFTQQARQSNITIKNERWAHEGDEFPSGTGSQSWDAFPENDYIEITSTAYNVDITLEVEFAVDRAYVNKNIKQLLFLIHTSGAGIFQRTDLFVADCDVTNHATGATSHAEFKQSTYSGTNEIIPELPSELGVGKGDQYEVDGLIYNKVKQHYYTTDKGEDIINGLSEIRLNLPANAQTEEGIICREGYVQKEGTKDGIVEKLIIHDDIFPSEVSMQVQDYIIEQRPARLTFPDASVGERMYNVWIVKDTYIHNDENNRFSKDYILDGETLKVKFRTGALAGMTFEVEFGERIKEGAHDERDGNMTQTYLIIPNTEYGALIPNDTMHPERGDEMLLLGWDCNAIEGLGMIAKAEELLLAAALDDLEAATDGSKTYRAQMLPNSKFTNEPLHDKDDEPLTSKDVYGEETLQIGQKVVLKDYALFEDIPNTSKRMRVIGCDSAIDYPWAAPTYIIGGIPKPTRREVIESLTKKQKTK